MAGAPGEPVERCLTQAGRDALTRLVDARRAHMSELIAEWPTEQREELAQQLRRLADGLVSDLPAQPA